MRKPAVAIAAALLLAGCGTDRGDQGDQAADEPSAPAESSSEPTSEPAEEPSVKPASGKVLRGSGFTFSVPKGWADVTEEATADVALRAADLSGATEVPAQLTVGEVNGGGRETESLEDRGTKDLGGEGLQKVAVAEPTEIDGAPAAHVQGVQPQPGAPLAVDRYYVVTDDGTWAITFSASRWLMKDDRQRTIDSVLATWDWK